MKEKARYVYGVIPRGHWKNFGKVGIGGRGDLVYTLPYKDICAVVSNTPFMKYEPNEENASAHEGVVEGVMRNTTVLPVKFCTIFQSQVGVKRMLIELYGEFKSNLKRLEGKVEMGVKVMWKVKAVMREVEKTYEKIVRMRKDAEKRSPGMAYLLKIRLDDAVKLEAYRKAGRLVADIYDSLKEYSEDARVNKPIGEDMLLNAAFLVRKDKIESFRKGLTEVKKKYSSAGFDFLASGPWPPYNFVDIRPKKERGGT